MQNVELPERPDYYVIAMPQSDTSDTSDTLYHFPTHTHVHYIRHSYFLTGEPRDSTEQVTLTHAVKSGRRTDKGYKLQSTAVRSFLSFLDVAKLFDYNPDKWKHIESLYDITDPDEVSRIVDALLDDADFVKQDNGKNQGWRSGSITHYGCFLATRAFFQNKLGKLSQTHAEQERNTDLSSSSASLQQIFYGAPGTGKSYIINEETVGEDVIRSTFHPDGCRYEATAAEGLQGAGIAPKGDDRQPLPGKKGGG